MFPEVGNILKVSNIPKTISHVIKDSKTWALRNFSFRGWETGDLECRAKRAEELREKRT